MKINLFFWRKKEEKISFPEKYGVVTYNPNALRNGIEDIENKVIIIYKYNIKIERHEVLRIYGYSDSLLHNLKVVSKIPIYDNTGQETKFPIFDEISLNEISYDIK